jgi:hypothetical protein
MTALSKPIRCAIYTRVSTDAGLDQEFNSLDAQYDAASAYIRSQAHAHWTLVRTRYDGRPCNSFWQTLGRAKFRSSSSIKSTA